MEVDSEGRFSTIFAYDCDDQPALCFWVEQFHEDAWHTVYKPGIGGVAARDHCGFLRYEPGDLVHIRYLLIIGRKWPLPS